MSERKRIALLLGQADEFYQRRFIDGFLGQAFAVDLDVCIFSMYLKYQDTEAREIGEKRIYSLVDFSLFDAVVVLPDTLQTPGLAREIEDRIKADYQGPVLYVDLESSTFPYILTDSYTPVRQLIEHLINVHGYRDIAFLTGKRWHEHSRVRLQAYRDVMNKAGLPVREDRIFYGDYWYTSGKTCAEELLKNRGDLPQAVACANDFMAIGLCDELAQNGLKVPEDIAVIGFDTSEEGQHSPSPLTSAYIPAKETGKRAARSVLKLMQGGSVDDSIDEAELFIGTSCGCQADDSIYSSFRRDTWATTLSEEGFHSLHNHFTEDMIAQWEFRSFWDIVYSHVYQISDYDSFHLCIPQDWDDPMVSEEMYRKRTSYSNKMIRVLASYRNGSIADRVGQREIFPTAKLLPDLWEPHDTPTAYTFTPLYFGARSFGYAAVSYGSMTRSYDEIYRLWIQAFCCGMESIRRTLLVRAMITENAMTDLQSRFPAGFAGNPVSVESFTEEDQKAIDSVRRLLDENLFTYHYQPIVSAVDGSIYAYEALMRAPAPINVSPLEILKYAGMINRLPDVERATFLNVLEQLGRECESFGERHIFINSIPGTKLADEDERQISDLLARCGSRAVVELTERAELDDEALEQMKKRYADLGVGTAVDDYGSGYSNISNLLRYMPDYVKVDRFLLSDIQNSPSKQHFVREIVNFSHDTGIKVLAEGVETPEELRTVISLGCDLIQGFYTGRPSARIVSHISPEIEEEIRISQRDRQEGTAHRSYTTGRSSRISAGSLVREGYQTIVTTGGEATYRDYVLSGTPGQNTELAIEVQEGYDGQITLENVSLISPKFSPCISIAPGARAVLVLHGENRLSGGGIMVPEGAELTVRGDGDLTIHVNQKQYAAIGSPSGKAGRIEFYQKGTILLEAKGSCGVGIGGMTGVDLHVYDGRYIMRLSGDQAAGMGVIDGDLRTDIRDCDIDIVFSGTSGVGIGSISGTAGVDILETYLHCTAKCGEFAVIGSIRGSMASMRFTQLGSDMEIDAGVATGAGALHGRSEIEMIRTSYRYTGEGAENYAYGGITGRGNLVTDESNITAHVSNDAGRTALL